MQNEFLSDIISILEDDAIEVKRESVRILVYTVRRLKRKQDIT